MERLMQYVWQHRLWPRTHLHTVDGRPVQILDPGRLNTDAGPDFFNAKVIIDGHKWAGDIEIHVRASDWHRHGHDNDPAYDSVILHVVDRDDAPICRSNGEIIPQMQMACTADFYQKYALLVDRADRDLPCAGTLGRLSSLHLHDWLDSLLFERLHAKAERIESWLELTQADWESAAYIIIARGLGFGINGDPFERLAIATPLRFIARHCDSLFTIEALLFGQSGLLESAPATDHYAAALKKEYSFMAHKFGLRPPQSPGWKMARMRPQNFPHRRIATLAALLHRTTRLASAMLDVTTMDQAVELFGVDLDGYWKDHYSFGPASRPSTARLSKASIATLVINAVAPLQFAYGMSRSIDAMADNAVDLLQRTPAENNRIVELFRQAGIKTPSAAVTQSLIQLRRNYCETRKCLYCRIGHRQLASQCPRL